MAEEKKVEAHEVDEVASNIESIIHTVNANPSLKEVGRPLKPLKPMVLNPPIKAPILPWKDAATA